MFLENEWQCNQRVRKRRSGDCRVFERGRHRFRTGLMKNERVDDFSLAKSTKRGVRRSVTQELNETDELGRDGCPAEELAFIGGSSGFTHHAANDFADSGRRFVLLVNGHFLRQLEKWHVWRGADSCRGKGFVCGCNSLDEDAALAVEKCTLVYVTPSSVRRSLQSTRRGLRALSAEGSAVEIFKDFGESKILHRFVVTYFNVFQTSGTARMLNREVCVRVALGFFASRGASSVHNEFFFVADTCFARRDPCKLQRRQNAPEFVERVFGCANLLWVAQHECEM